MGPSDAAGRPAPLASPLIAAARALVGSAPRALLGIAGAPGAGKTTLARGLVQALNDESPGSAAHVPMDGFHLADVTLARHGTLERKGAPETFDGWGYVELLRRLRATPTYAVFAPAFERTLEQPLAGAIEVDPAARLVVTEGNYLLLEQEPWSLVGSPPGRGVVLRGRPGPTYPGADRAARHLRQGADPRRTVGRVRGRGERARGGGHPPPRRPGRLDVLMRHRSGFGHRRVKDVWTCRTCTLIGPSPRGGGPRERAEEPMTPVAAVATAVHTDHTWSLRDVDYEYGATIRRFECDACGAVRFE